MEYSFLHKLPSATSPFLLTEATQLPFAHQVMPLSLRQDHHPMSPRVETNLGRQRNVPCLVLSLLITHRLIWT
jgi:hypothetical protein